MDRYDYREPWERPPEKKTAENHRPAERKKAGAAIGDTKQRRAAMGVCIFVMLAAVSLIVVNFSIGSAPTRDVPIPSHAIEQIFPENASPYASYDSFSEYFDAVYSYDPGGSSIGRFTAESGTVLSLSSHDERSQLSLQEVYGLCAPSVVSIKAFSGPDSGAYFWGSGVIMTDKGYIITNAHVIEGTERALVLLSDGREYEALLVGEDSKSDIALLKIEADGLSAAEFGDSNELTVGDKVVAIGNPLGQQFAGTMTDGIVSAISRDLEVSSGYSTPLIQTNAAINEGNSGGPLINMYGQVVGITNMKMVAGLAEATIEGIGFAIPSATVQEVIGELIENGAVTGRPSIGIVVGSVSESAADYYDIPQGLYISRVNENSDAFVQGLQPGDIITYVNGTSVYTTSDVSLIIRDMSVGDTVDLVVYRAGENGKGYKVFTLSVQLVDSGRVS